MKRYFIPLFFILFLSLASAEISILKYEPYTDEEADTKAMVLFNPQLVEIGADIIPEITTVMEYPVTIWVRYPEKFKSSVKLKKAYFLSNTKVEYDFNGVSKYKEYLKTNDDVNILAMQQINFDPNLFLNNSDGTNTVVLRVILDVDGKENILEKEYKFYIDKTNFNELEEKDSKLTGSGNMNLWWYAADLHVHTNISSGRGGCSLESANAQGYNLADLKTRARAVNLTLVFLTDHSYCLDSGKWNRLSTQARTLSGPSFQFSVGEELTVDEDCIGGNDVAHLGSLFLSSFIAQQPTNTWTPTSPGSQAGINLVKNQANTMAVINHPKDLAWDWKCASSTNGIRAVEVWNGRYDQSAVNWWINNFLLKGKYVIGVGGSDSHEPDTVSTWNMMGKVKTIISSRTPILNDPTPAYNALRSVGPVYVTNNGILRFNVTVLSGTVVGKGEMGEVIDIPVDDKGTARIQVNAMYWVRPSSEMSPGIPCELKICKGANGWTSEVCTSFGTVNNYGVKSITETITSNTYYRAQCIARASPGMPIERAILSNPIWLNFVR